MASSSIQFSSVQFSRSVVSDSLRPHESSSITAWQMKAEKVEVVTDFLFLDSKVTVNCDSMKSDDCFLEGK